MTQEQFVDYGNAVEVYVDDLQRIDVLGQTVVWTFYRYQLDPASDAEYSKVVTLKIITPSGTVPKVARKISDAFGEHIMQRELGKFRKAG